MSAVKRRKQKLGAGDRAFNIVLGGLTAVSVVVILYPLIFVLVASISDPMEIFQGNVWLWPKGFNLEAYKQVFRNGDIFTGYKNTLIYTVVGTLVTIIITFSAAYPLSRKKLYGRSKLMGFFLFTMFFSGGMIPTYLMVKNLGLYNTTWAVILVGTVSVYNIIVARTFMQNTIPEELYEAASMDGAGRIRKMLNITLPCIAPTIATLLILRMGSFMDSSFDQLFLMVNDANRSVGEVFDTYIYVQGISGGKFSYTTAVGIIKSVISMVMVASSNAIAKKLGSDGIM
mgnify:FL=1